MAWLMKRRDDDSWDFDDDDGGNWWYSQTAMIVKWAIIGLLFVLFFTYIFGGYFHAKSRARKGLPPLAYHRWLLPAHQRARLDPSYRRPQNQFSFYHHQRQDYNMDNMPPPAYNPSLAPPPSYQPPAGASKTDPAQHYASVPPQMDGPSDVGLAMPPPAHAPAGTNPFH